MAKVPEIKDFIPCGNWVFVELLNEEEILGTELHLVSSVNEPKALDGAPQAYIKGVGTKVDDSWGFNAGDRVLFSTSQFIPCPQVKLEDDAAESLDAHNKPKRARGLIAPQHVVCIVKE